MENNRDKSIIKENNEENKFKSKDRLNVNTLINRLKEENRNERNFNLLLIIVISCIAIGAFVVFNLFF